MYNFKIHREKINFLSMDFFWIISTSLVFASDR